MAAESVTVDQMLDLSKALADPGALEKIKQAQEAAQAAARENAASLQALRKERDALAGEQAKLDQDMQRLAAMKAEIDAAEGVIEESKRRHAQTSQERQDFLQERQTKRDALAEMQRELDAALEEARKAESVALAEAEQARAKIAQLREIIG